MMDYKLLHISIILIKNKTLLYEIPHKSRPTRTTCFICPIRDSPIKRLYTIYMRLLSIISPFLHPRVFRQSDKTFPSDETYCRLRGGARGHRLAPSSINVGNPAFSALPANRAELGGIF